MMSTTQKRLWRILLTVVIIALIAVGIMFRHRLNLIGLQSRIDAFGIWAPIVFILLYILATVLFLPGAIFTLAGGLLFGAYLGTVYNLIGAVCGASLAFLIARFIAADWVQKKTGHGALHRLVDGVNDSGWRFVAVVRLIPLIPFNLLNYALGLTAIPLGSYIIASAIFMLPGTFAYTYVGALGIAFIHGDAQEIISKVSIAVGIFVILAAMPWVIKKLRGNGKEDNVHH